MRQRGLLLRLRLYLSFSSVFSNSYLEPVKSDLFCILFAEEYRLAESSEFFGILFHPHGNGNVHLSAKLYKSLLKALGIGGISVLCSDFPDLSHPVGNKEPTFKFQDIIPPKA